MITRTSSGLCYSGFVAAGTVDVEALGFCSETFNGHAVAAVEQSPRAFVLLGSFVVRRRGKQTRIGLALMCTDCNRWSG